MRIFFTRHGQVFSAKYHNGDAQRPVGNSALSELGREQAAVVANRLKALHFQGVILSSPYDRTLETAQIIAEIVDSQVYPLAGLQEMFVECPIDKPFNGFTGEEIVRRYNRAKLRYPLSFPWWENKSDDLADVIERVKEGLAPILPDLLKNTDVLLVGHAATAVALRHLFGITDQLKGFHWNCHLSLLYDTDGQTPYACDCSFMSMEQRTGNRLLAVDREAKMAQKLATVYEFKQKYGDNLVLHIGDTESASYLDTAKLIDAVQPKIIIHTGDLVDEIKAGRIESVRPYWKPSAWVMIDIMKQSGARVIVVPGNNDLLDTLRERTDIEVVPPCTVMEFGGKKVYLTHAVMSIDEQSDAEIYLYGHGLTGETRTKTDNERDGKRYFNDTWGSSLHCFEKDAHVIL